MVFIFVLLHTPPCLKEIQDAADLSERTGEGRLQGHIFPDHMSWLACPQCVAAVSVTCGSPHPRWHGAHGGPLGLLCLLICCMLITSLTEREQNHFTVNVYYLYTVASNGIEFIAIHSRKSVVL